MRLPDPTAQKIRFEAFELDRLTGELYKNGAKLKLQGQPIAVLALLLERPGELITREELRKHLWPEDTFVDFEHSLNTHIKKLRQVLDDNAETPRYIETLPRRGYRFIAQVEAVPNGSAIVAGSENPASIPASAPSAPQPLPSPEPARQPPPKPPPWKYAATAFLLLAIAAGLIYWFFRPRTPVVTAIHQLTRDGLPKGARDGPKSDGTRLYFDVFRGNNFHTGQVPIQGGEVSYLDLPMIESAFVHGISADGKQLEVFDEPVDITRSIFWLVPLPEGSPRRIPGTYLWAKLLPGNEEIVFIPSSDLRHLYTSKLDGTDAHPVLTLPGEISASSSGGPINVVALSPDGRKVRLATTDGKMWESNLDGTGMHRFLPEFSQPMCCGQWSRDGRLYTFLIANEGVNDIWAISNSGWSSFLHNPRAVQLTHGPLSFGSATPSSDGKQLFASGATLRGELNLYDSKASAFRPYLNGISAGFPDFSRDGQWVAYVTHPQGTLWRSRTDGSEKLQLTFSPMGTILNPRWSPDGRFLAFMEVGEDWRKVYLISADGGAPLLLLSGDFQPSDPSWSPDGKFIAYGGVPPSVTGHPALTEIRILDLETKQSRTVAGSQGLFSPRWSPDGRYLAAQSADELHLWLYNFETNRWKELPVPRMPKWDNLGWPAWSHDSHYLYFMSWSDIYKVRVPHGSLEVAASISGLNVICPVLPWPGSFGLTPDDRILILLDRGSTELYALDLAYR